MQRFTNSTFNIRKDRFRETGPKFDTVSITKIDIGNSFDSINLEEEFFTNFASSKDQKVYKLVEDFYKIYINNEDPFKDYCADEIYYKEKVIDRLINIINEVNDEQYEKKDLPYIFKMKNKSYPKLHLYITVNNNFAKIILIDLFHIGIPGDKYSKGKFIKSVSLKDVTKIYDKLKKNSYDLNNIFL